MNKLYMLGLLGLMMGLVLMAPSPMQAAESKAADPCIQHKDKDQLNLCRAFEIDKAKSDAQKKNRYQNKNHTTYYCSLIKNRELHDYAKNPRFSSNLITWKTMCNPSLMHYPIMLVAH